MIPTITGLDLDAPSFKRSLEKASPALRDDVRKALKKLIENPTSNTIRAEKLTAYSPAIYTIHCNGNHTHKLSFSIDGTIAKLRVLGTHKEINRSP